MYIAQDEENLQRAHNEVPTNDELNTRLARSPAELATFRAMDAEMNAVSNPMSKTSVYDHCSHLFHLYLFVLLWLEAGVETGMLLDCEL